MTTTDLETLAALTRDYAAFQPRKSGLATALGGLMAILFLTAPMYVDALGSHPMGHCLLEYLLLAPFVWLAVKNPPGPRPPSRPRSGQGHPES